MNERGTRFLLFAQAGDCFPAPELVRLSPPPGSIGPGPSDARMYAITPAGPKPPYEPPDYLPPYCGVLLPPALPDREGHFDHIGPNAPEFAAAHLYAAARFTLDVWERFLGHPVRWWHADIRPRVELVADIAWDNAHSGPGYVETGTRRNAAGIANRFGLNLDVVAHELGHAIVFSEVGVPAPGRVTAQYLALHESISDLVALITALHLDSVVDLFLDQAAGNLYALSVVNRVGELSDLEQIRSVDFHARLDAFRGFDLLRDGTWRDPSGLSRTQHQLSQPLTAAIFAAMIEVYQDALVADGLIPADDDSRGWTEDEIATDLARLVARYGSRLDRLRPLFRDALARARDWVGLVIARLLARLAPDDLSFAGVARAFIEAAEEVGATGNEAAFLLLFTTRDFAVDDPRRATIARRLSYFERVVAASGGRPTSAAQFAALRRLMPHSFRGEPSW